MADTALSVTNIKPLAGYVLIEPSKAEKTTVSGIILPESEEKPQTGTVLATGPATMDDGAKIECPVKKGDVVIYKKWGGNELKVGDVEYQVLKFEDLIAVVTK